MSIKINSDAYYQFKGLLERFCGDAKISRLDQELTNRNIFATNMLDALNNIDIEDDDLVKLFNSFLESVNSFEIPLIDIYQLCGTTTFNGTSLLKFFEKYGQNAFLQIKGNAIENILTALEHSENRAVLDVLNLITSAYIYNQQVYVKPNIEYSYIMSNSYFVNRVDVMKDFYSGTHGTAISTAIFSKSVEDFTNIELRRLLSSIQQSYNDKNSLLLKFGANSPNNTMLVYVKNFNNIFNGSSYESYTDKCKALLINNIYVTDVKDMLHNLALDLYKPYMYDVLAYANRSLEFNAETYMSKLSITDTADITIDTYKYEIIKSYITGASENIVNYAKEVIMMQNYLKTIYTAILTDSRYSMEV